MHDAAVSTLLTPVTVACACDGPPAYIASVWRGPCGLPTSGQARTARTSRQRAGVCRELCSLIGVVKLVFVTICGHMEPAARKACVMQLSPPAMLDVCTVVHNLLARPTRALAGGTQQAEIDLLAKVAADIIPRTADWFLTLVGARCLHTVGLWQSCQPQARCLPYL